MGNLSSHNLIKKYSYSSIQFKGKILTEKLIVKIINNILISKEYDLFFSIIRDFQDNVLIKDQKYLNLLLLERNSNKNINDFIHINPLFFAIENDFPYDIISYINLIDSSYIHEVDKKGRNVVYYICKYSNNSKLFDALKILYNNNDQRHLYENLFLTTDIDGFNSIHHACYHSKSSLEIVKWLVENFKDLPQYKTKAGAYPFHLALQSKASSEVLLYLLNQYSDVCFSTYNANTALHIACMNKAQYIVVSKIINRYPKNVSLIGADSKYALHCALEHKCDLEVVKLLVSSFPEALHHRDAKGRMPFHYALEKKASEEMISYLLNIDPMIASERGRGQPGNLPLSMAIDNHIETTSILNILRAYPKAASIKDIYNLYPLSAAMNEEVDINLLNEILDAYPPAAEEVDQHGRLALHYAISRLYPIYFIKSLLRAYPDGVKHQDRNGQLPLHLACIRASSIDHIVIIREAFEGGTSVLDNYNNVPVNYLLESKAKLDYIKAIVNNNPSSLKQINSKGNIPLHYAIYFLCDYSIVDYLLEVNPQACEYEKYDAKYIAIELAIIRPSPIDILLRIEQTYPKCAFHKTSINYNPIHYALKMKSHVSLVQRFLMTYPDIAKQNFLNCHLINTINSSGILNFIDYNALEKEEKVGEKEERKDINDQSKTHKKLDHSHGEITYSECCQGNRLLLTFAIEINSTQEAVAEIAKLTMPYPPGSTVLNKEHHYSWTHLVSHANDLYARAVEILLDNYSQIEIQTLANFPDEKGSPAISIATYNTHAAILQKLHFQGRYQVDTSIYFQSDTSLIKRAVDFEGHDNSQHNVILKFISDRKCFLNEIKFREKHNIHDRILKDSNMTNIEYKLFQDQRRLEALNDKTSLTIPCVASHNSEEDFTFRDEAAARGFGKWPYLLIFPGATLSLREIIINQNFAGKNDEITIHYCNKLLLACNEFHNKYNSCHGNIHPGHIFLLRDKLVLGDLSLAQGYSFNETLIHDFGHRALAYSSPEVVQVYYEKSKFIPTDENPEYQCELFAAQSQDLWSIGAVIYYLFTGEPLFLTRFDETIDQDQIEILRKWPKFMKEKRMKKIKCSIARNLVDQLLSHDPSLRPDCSYCLTHPIFFKDKALGRFVGTEATTDIYISYRKKFEGKSFQHKFNKIKSLVREDQLIPDKVHSDKIIEILESCKYTLTDGSTIYDSYGNLYETDNESALFELIEKAFLDITYHKSMFIILSRFGLNCDFFNLSTLTKISEINLYLFQIRIALELSSRGLLEGGVYILAIGDKDEPGILDIPNFVIEQDNEKPMIYSSFFYHQHSKNDRTTTCLPEVIPNIVLSSLESITSSLLLKYGYGKLHYPKLTLKDMIQKVLQFPIFEVVGFENVALTKTCEDIRCSLSSKFSNKIIPLSLSRPPTTSAFSKIIDTNLTSTTSFFDNDGDDFTSLTPNNNSSFAQRKRVNISNFSDSKSNYNSDEKEYKLVKTFSSGTLSRFGRNNYPDQSNISNNNSPSKFASIQAEKTSSELPYFTEVVGLDKAQSESMVKFLVEKMEIKENEVKNLNFEIELLQERIKFQQEEIHRLKLYSSVIKPSI